MYEQYFRLSRRPFLPAPTLDCVVEHAGYVAARDAILRCLSGDAGICLLTAPAGLGKSLLCQDIIARVERDATIAYLCSAQFPNRRSLLQAILFELREDYQGLTEDEARLAVIDAVRSRAREGRRLITIIDEAHLVSSELLEELRVLAEPLRGGEAGMQLILSGQLEFEERLSDRDLDSLNQRIGCHAVIEPLTQEESAAYIATRLAWAGGSLELFSWDALTLIVNLCDGNPRCIHQLVDHCFLSALACGEKPISLATVKAAFDDLRSLPLHWNDAALDDSESHSLSADAEFDEPLEPLQRDDGSEVLTRVSNSSAQTPGFSSTGQSVAFVEIGGEETVLQSPADAIPGSASAFEIVPDDDVLEIEGETVIDDPYARIDRISQGAFSPAIPEAPDLMRFLAQFTIDNPEPRDGASKANAPSEHSSEAEEQTLLDTIRDLQAELRTARAEQADRVDVTASWAAAEALQFDVVEPEDAAEIVEPQVIEAPRQEIPSCHATGASEGPSRVQGARTDEAITEPAERYSRLFTRIRQRRRAASQRLERDDII